jgi:hypothetical protein
MAAPSSPRRLSDESSDAAVQPSLPNPRRVAAGKRNRAKRGGLTPGGRKRLQLAALLHEPWLHSTGPRTAEGKARVALNGKKRQVGSQSVREIRAELADLQSLLGEMKERREAAMRTSLRRKLS